MSVTHTALCTVKGCPAPKDPDWHKPWCGHGVAGEHQHWPKRSQGGKRIVAFLCHDCHDRIDNGDWGNSVVTTMEDGKQIEIYRAWDLHNETIIERVINGGFSDGAEAVVRTPASPPDVSAASLKEESDGEPNRQEANVPPLQDAPEDNDVLAGHGSRDLPPVRDRARGSVRPERAEGEHLRDPLTHEQRVAKALEIKNAEWNRQWIAGDTANQWRAELGEEAEQYISDFGYVQESIANIMRVCEAIPKNIRRAELRFSHHVVMLGLNREDMDMWLDKCEEEQWSVAEFRRQVKGTKPKVKRWALEELRELVGEFENDVGDEDHARDFLDWLGEQG